MFQLVSIHIYLIIFAFPICDYVIVVALYHYLMFAYLAVLGIYVFTICCYVIVGASRYH